MRFKSISLPVWEVQTWGEKFGNLKSRKFELKLELKFSRTKILKFKTPAKKLKCVKFG